MPSIKSHEVIPSARRLIKSLRDMGYDFAAAAADLVDNSIAAEASLVAIDVEFDGDDSWVRIADNGRGMTPAQLKEAMRYGSEREYDTDDLGKFGLGLKTASMSQCQRLSVASRTNPDRADIAAWCWDHEHIEKTNRWEILPLERNSLGPAIHKPLKDMPGTVVLWQQLDRILGYAHPYGEFARKRLSTVCRELEEHLAMVFHRFLANEVRGKKLKILLNGNEVHPWDPFARAEPATKELTAITFQIDHEGTKGVVELQPFVLPHQEDFSSTDAFKRASGPANWNQQQGFYVYRANRLIQSGGWSRLRTVDEHTKLARVALRFQPALDEAFKINVAKMRVQLPSQLKEDIERALRPAIKIAQETYRKKTVKHFGGATTTAGAYGADNSNASGQVRAAATKKGRDYATSSETELTWTVDEFEVQLQSIAKSDERPVITRVLKRLRKHLKHDAP